MIEASMTFHSEMLEALFAPLRLLRMTSFEEIESTKSFLEPFCRCFFTRDESADQRGDTNQENFLASPRASTAWLHVVRALSDA